MRAAVIPCPGGPEVLVIRDVPTPAPSSDEVLVRVVASALNRADLLQRLGKYPAPPGAPANIPGIEFAGEIVEVGSSVPPALIGQRVFGIAGGGAHSEFLVAHQRAVAVIPECLSWIEAAAVPEAFVTAHDALWVQAALRPCERVLIHAVGSGVGLAAVQLVRAIGAVPYGTARTQEKIDRARELGLADGLAVGSDLTTLAPAVETWTAHHGIDVVLDLAGGPYVGASLAVLALRGRLLLVGSVAGRRAEIDLGLALSRRVRLTGTVLRARPLEEKIATIRAFESEVVPLLATGAVAPVVDSVFDLDSIVEAHVRLESNATFGKVVIRVAHDASSTPLE